MKEVDGVTYAESLDEYYALVGDETIKEPAREVSSRNSDIVARYGLSDDEYEALTQPVRVYLH